MATHSSILAQRIPWTEKPGGPWGRKALDMTNTFTFIVVYNVMPISVVQQSDSVIHIRHSFFFFFGCNLCHGGGGGSQFPNQGWNPRPLHWRHRVLTTGPPGKSQTHFFCSSVRWKTNLQTDYYPPYWAFLHQELPFCPLQMEISYLVVQTLSESGDQGHWLPSAVQNSECMVNRKDQGCSSFPSKNKKQKRNYILFPTLTGHNYFLSFSTS